MAELTMGIRYQVDMDKPTQATRLSTRLYQGDEEANRITLELVRGGKQANVGTLTVTGEMERADGARVPCEGSQNGSTVSIVLNEHCYYVPGPCVIYLRASAGGVLRTMLELHGQVVQKSNGPMVDVNEELVDVNAVIQLYGEMRMAKGEAERAAAAADEAATDAANAATRANDAAQSIEWLTVSASPGAAPDAEITDQDGAKHIHFTLQTGATPDITFEVATGAPGTQVQVQQSGTPEAPHVLLTIPRGDTGAVDGIDYFEGAPSALGTASPGTANGVARGDHVHPMPTAEQVGARPDGWMPTAEQVGARPDVWTPSLNDVAFLGLNPIAGVENDTVKNWIALGSGYCRYNVSDLLESQPTQYGVLITYCIDNDVFQLWKAMPSGEIFHRAGNANGWGGTWDMLLTTGAKASKTLWEGSWSSGNITVPRTDKYSLFRISMSGQGTAIIGVKQGVHIRGIGGYSSATPTITSYQFAASFEGNTWTFIACNSIQHKGSGSHSDVADNTVTSITGIC